MVSEEDFHQLYKRLGVLGEEGSGLPLHRHCPNREICWRDVERRFPPDDNPWSHISRPWVGPNYCQLRLLIVGINLNEDGGYSELVDLVCGAQQQLREGKKKHFVQRTYGGALFYHRAASYAVVFLEHAGLVKAAWNDRLPGGEDCASALEYAAMSQHVKCSPRCDRSAPTKGMWETCGRYILREEIKLLKPTWMLILGSGNADKLRERVLDRFTSADAHGQVRSGQGRVEEVSFRTFEAPHPTQGKSISLDIEDSLRVLLPPKR